MGYGCMVSILPADTSDIVVYHSSFNSVPVSKLPDLVYETKQDIQELGLVSTIVGHVGDGQSSYLSSAHSPLMSPIGQQAISMHCSSSGMKKNWQWRERLYTEWSNEQ